MVQINKFLFKEWLGKSPEAMFGFKSVLQKVTKPFYLEQPIEEFKVADMLKDLISMGNLNNKVVDNSWSNMLTYGKGVGKIEIDTSPYGSFKLIVRRYVNDLKGKNTAVCRLVVPLINDFNHRGPNDPSELIVATKLYDQLKNIDAEEFPTPSNKWNDKFARFVQRFANLAKVSHPEIMIYEGTLKLNENNYLISFTYKGYGNGLPQSQKAEKFLINMQYLPDEGLIHSWGYEVASPNKSREYYALPSEWDEYFCPSQPEKQIIDCLHKIFMTY